MGSCWHVRRHLATPGRPSSLELPPLLRTLGRAGSFATMRDTETWAFGDTGPWEVDLERLTWRGEVATLREQTRTLVPALVRPRTLPPVWRFAEASALIGASLLAWILRERRRGGSVSRAGLSHR